ncbi:unnamed protein product, partial [Brassica oleracea]
ESLPPLYLDFSSANQGNEHHHQEISKDNLLALFKSQQDLLNHFFKHLDLSQTLDFSRILRHRLLHRRRQIRLRRQQNLPDPHLPQLTLLFPLPSRRASRRHRRSLIKRRSRPFQQIRLHRGASPSRPLR